MKPKTEYEQQFDLNSGVYIGSSWEPNAIRHAAEGYLSAAEIIFKTEENKKGFLEFQNWFVAHHLSYIACELYVKSFAAKSVILSDELQSPDELQDPEPHRFTISDWGHNGLFGKLPKEERVQLKNHLISDHFSMLSEMCTGELTRSRYPYQRVETNDDNNGCDTFQTGDIGKQIAERWILFARALSVFHVSVVVKE